MPFRRGQQLKQATAPRRHLAHDRPVAFKGQFAQVSFAVFQQTVVGFGGGQIQRGGRSVFAVRPMTAHALLVEHRLDKPVEPQRPRALGTGLQQRWLAGGGQRHSGDGRRHVAVFVTPDTGQGLAGLNVSQRPHGLHGQSVPVQRLEEHGNARGDLEIGRTVGLDRNIAQDEFAGVFARHAQTGLIHLRLDLGRHSHNPQLADRTARHADQALIDVLHQERALLRIGPADQVGQRRRLGTSTHRNRRDTVDLRIAVQQGQIPEGVVQIDAAGVGRVAGILGRHQRMRRQTAIGPRRQIILLGQRPGMRVVVIRPALGFRKTDFGRQPGQRPFELVAPSAVQQDERTAGDRMMGGRGENQLRRIGDRPRLEHRLRPGGVVAVHQLPVGSVRVGRPEAEEISVEAVDVVPPRVQNPPVAGHRRQPLEILEGGNRAQIAAVGVHAVQREHGHGPMIAAAAAHKTVRLSDLQCGLRADLVRLQRRAFAGRHKNDSSVGQIPRVEIVVAAVCQLPDGAVLQIHLEHVVERILRQLVLVGFVRHRGQFGIVAAPGEQHAASVVGNVRIEETALGPILGQAADGRVVPPNAVQQVQPPARPRPPTVVLIGNVRKQRRCAFDEQNSVEVQQRIAQRHPAHGLASVEIPLPLLRLVHVDRRIDQAVGRLLQAAAGGIHVHSALLQIVGQLQAALDHRRRRFEGCGVCGHVPRGPLTGAALRCRLVQGDVVVRAARVDLDLVQVKVAPAGQLQPHEPRFGAVQRHAQRFPVGMAEELGAVVLIDAAEIPAVVREQDQDAAGPGREAAIASVVQHDAVQRRRMLQINLPPRLLLVLGMEAPFAVFDAVDGARRIFRDADRRPAAGRRLEPQFQLPQPVRFQLLASDGRTVGQQHLARQRRQQGRGEQYPATTGTRFRFHRLSPKSAVVLSWQKNRATMLFSHRSDRLSTALLAAGLSSPDRSNGLPRRNAAGRCR